MIELFNLIEKYSYDIGLTIDLYYSSIVDWRLKIGFKVTRTNHGKYIVDVQDCDRERVFSLAYIQLTDWLSENNGGY